jgi:hypothetical protein
MGFTVFLVSSGATTIDVVPEEPGVSLPVYTPQLNNPNDLGVLRNVDGSNSWSYVVARPYTGGDINEESMTGNLVLDDSASMWQVLKCNGSSRVVNITATIRSKEFLIINDDDSGDNTLTLQDAGVPFDTLRPGESLWCKRLTTKWIALRFAQHGISST